MSYWHQSLVCWSPETAKGWFSVKSRQEGCCYIRTMLWHIHPTVIVAESRNVDLKFLNTHSTLLIWHALTTTTVALRMSFLSQMMMLWMLWTTSCGPKMVPLGWLGRKTSTQTRWCLLHRKKINLLHDCWTKLSVLILSSQSFWRGLAQRATITERSIPMTSRGE